MTAYKKATLAILAGGIILVALAFDTRPAAMAAAPAATLSAVAAGSAITTSGEAMIKVKPDIAVLILGMTADSTSADAQAQVAQRVAGVLKAAKDLGIEDKHVKTHGYNLNTSYQPNSYPKISGDQPGGYIGPTGYGSASAAAGRLDTVVPVGDLDVVIRVQVQYASA